MFHNKISNVWKHEPTNKSIQAVTLTMESDFWREATSGWLKTWTNQASFRQISFTLHHLFSLHSLSYVDLLFSSVNGRWQHMTLIHLPWILILLSVLTSFCVDRRMRLAHWPFSKTLEVRRLKPWKVGSAAIQHESKVQVGRTLWRAKWCVSMFGSIL